MMTEMTRYKQQTDMEEDASSLSSGRTVEFSGSGRSGGTTRTRCHMRFNYWRSRTRLERALIIISSALFMTVFLQLCLLVRKITRPELLVIHDHPMFHEDHEPYDISGSLVCLDASCVKIAGSILRRMNLSADPCDDFYEYSCGGWIASSVKPEGKPSWGTLNELASDNEVTLRKVLESTEDTESAAEKKAKIYYRSCIDANDTVEALGATPLLNLIEKVGGWSLGGNWTSDNYSLEADILQTKGKYNSGALFYWGVAEDEKNSSNYIIKFDQGGLMLPARDYYLNESEKAIVEAYAKYFTKIGVLLGAGENKSRSVVEDIIKIETKLAEITTPDEARRDDEKNYHSMTLAELTEKADFMDWTKFVGSAVRGINNFPNILSDTRVVVYAPEYLGNLSKILKQMAKTPKGAVSIHNYLTWHIVKNYIGFLSRDFTQAYSILQKAQVGISSAEDDWRECVAATDAAFGPALGAMYVRKAFSEDARKMAVHMLDGVRNSFKENLRSVSWMAPKTKAAAIEKTNYISQMIGYPVDILNSKELDKKLEEVKVSENSFFENNINVTNFRVKENLLRLFKQVNKTRWDMTPPTANAYYSPTRNNIVLPAGILQPPLFAKENPEALNYGAVGVVMGHELSHAFDDQGRKYDKNGNLNSWWEDTTAQRFEKKTQCMINQYSEYTLGKEHLKGKLTLGENIADNGGLKASFDAFQQRKGKKEDTVLPGLNMTSNQLFFLAFGQVWCSTMTKEAAHLEILRDTHVLPEYRVKGTLSNSKEFAEAYKCSSTSAMVRKNRCVVW